MKHPTTTFLLEVELPFLSDTILYGLDSYHNERTNHRLTNRKRTELMNHGNRF